MGKLISGLGVGFLLVPEGVVEEVAGWLQVGDIEMILALENAKRNVERQPIVEEVAVLDVEVSQTAPHGVPNPVTQREMVLGHRTPPQRSDPPLRLVEL